MNTKRSVSAARGRAILGLALVLVLPACGGGGGGSPTPPTPVPTRNLIGTQAFELVSPQQASAVGFPFDIGLVVFVINVTANPLEGIAQWSSPANDVDVILYRGECTPQGFYNQACTEITNASSATAKPERLVANNLAAGTYTLVVANLGPGRESGTLQIFATTQ